MYPVLPPWEPSAPLRRFRLPEFAVVAGRLLVHLLHHRQQVGELAAARYPGHLERLGHFGRGNGQCRRRCDARRSYQLSVDQLPVVRPFFKPLEWTGLTTGN